MGRAALYRDEDAGAAWVRPPPGARVPERNPTPVHSVEEPGVYHLRSNECGNADGREEGDWCLWSNKRGNDGTFAGWAPCHPCRG